MNLNDKMIAGENGLPIFKESSSFLMKTNDAICSAVSKAILIVSQTTKGKNPDDDNMNVPSRKVDVAASFGIPEISLDEVFWHDSIGDCWIVVYDRVYDITDFLQEHPGGEEVLLEHAGRDATIAFNGVGHSIQALKALEKYLIGVLPEKERIFTQGRKKLFESLTSLSLGT